MSDLNSFAAVPEAAIYLGAPQTGKTQRIVEDIAGLVEQGVPAGDILVLCATPSAAQVLSSRLAAVSPLAAGVKVAGARDYFLEVLGTDDACACTGRKPRLLLPYEYDFVLEDLKTTGGRPKRLREVLKFLYRGYVTLDTDDPEWLITNEEREIVGILKDAMITEGAIIEHEIPVVMVDYLRKGKHAAEVACRPYVFADDFTMQPEGVQVAASMLALKKLVIAADPDANVPALDIFPSLEGIDKFQKKNPDAQVTHLTSSFSCGASGQACRALRAENGLGAEDTAFANYDPTGYELLEGEDAQDEVAKVVASVKQRIAAGASPSDIVVATPVPSWRRRITKGLLKAGVPADTFVEPRFLKLDVRHDDTCYIGRFITLLTLAANPEDGVAWRCWCGFGDWLTNSNGFKHLRAEARHKGLTLPQVMATGDLMPGDMLAGRDVLASSMRIMRSRDDLKARLETLQGLEGEALLTAIASSLQDTVANESTDKQSQWAQAAATVKALAFDPAGDNSAAAMDARFRAAVLQPRPNGTDAIRVVSLGDLAGLTPKHLYIASFLNGFFPKPDYLDGTTMTIEMQDRRRKEDLNLIASVVAKATESLTISYTKTFPLEEAERSKVTINRISFTEGKRVAHTEPSIYLEFMGR